MSVWIFIAIGAAIAVGLYMLRSKKQEPSFPPIAKDDGDHDGGPGEENPPPKK